MYYGWLCIFGQNEVKYDQNGRGTSTGGLPLNWTLLASVFCDLDLWSSMTSKTRKPCNFDLALHSVDVQTIGNVCLRFCRKPFIGSGDGVFTGFLSAITGWPWPLNQPMVPSQDSNPWPINHRSDVFPIVRQTYTQAIKRIRTVLRPQILENSLPDVQ